MLCDFWIFQSITVSGLISTTLDAPWPSSIDVGNNNQVLGGKRLCTVTADISQPV
jgi:hypothetical protein